MDDLSDTLTELSEALANAAERISDNDTYDFSSLADNIEALKERIDNLTAAIEEALG